MEPSMPAPSMVAALSQGYNCPIQDGSAIQRTTRTSTNAKRYTAARLLGMASHPVLHFLLAVSILPSRALACR